MKRKKEMIDTIISSFRSYELEMIVPVKEDDTTRDIGTKIEQLFNTYKKEDLKPLYKAAARRLRYSNIGLIA